MSTINPENIVVFAEEMRQIETEIFAQEMPVPALMEKAALSIFQHIQIHYPQSEYLSVSVLVGSGHNGGDALVVARELHLAGYQVLLYCPLPKFKSLTQKHFDYAQFLGIDCAENIDNFLDCKLIIDGLFGFGLEREVTGHLAILIERINQRNKTVVSIDLPSGLHTDTGEALGIAIEATESLCLGLWKRLYVQDQAIPYLGKPTRLDFGIPTQLLEPHTKIQRIDVTIAKRFLPLRRSPLTHKYKQGNLLLIGGSDQYAGSIILAGLGARATGVGMLTIAVPKSLKPLVVARLPEALVIGCPETEDGAIAELPDLDFVKYGAIACGCGLTLQGATNIMPKLVKQEVPLILDADALNWLAQNNLSQIQNRQAPTVLTPHLGEFRRIFPMIEETGDRLTMTQQAAQLSNTITLLKGAKTIVANPNGQIYCSTASTPALARGGSGDVLLGIAGGLLSQNPTKPLEVTATAAWWHAQAGILAAKEQTLAGVDGVTLATYLTKFLTTMDTCM
ncbi:YjeF-related protein [[Leptolyngbya] sp. PCC 7376]|uniref:bifunctional ADP-dependent NAD(P)H-hydrate dehydratase/NAD(P)H-hydrate epimerase n=1 Tax=[Leptolyngbya] sp. PCC 7376 TaxID=111781 RepID=UPI00029EE8A5|nr:bifunctional ADP-dependent NAD(P)H-hydrate dehydratase/NAD(P)H-hydrate epimerase [[Leptolyngbya] sp. PCC 7376]AFY37564.1 YjeF-related protein [[Leptolyngbya] sp. PCC 7376]